MEKSVVAQGGYSVEHTGFGYIQVPCDICWAHCSHHFLKDKNRFQIIFRWRAYFQSYHFLSTCIYVLQTQREIPNHSGAVINFDAHQKESMRLVRANYVDSSIYLFRCQCTWPKDALYNCHEICSEVERFIVLSQCFWSFDNTGIYFVAQQRIEFNISAVSDRIGN